jgi:hypothetical protein
MGKMGLNKEQLKKKADIGTANFNPWRDDVTITVVRTVIMSPFHFSAFTQSKFRDEKKHLFDEYTQFLNKQMAELIRKNMSQPFLKDTQYSERRPAIKGKVLILEDNIETMESLVHLVKETFNFEIPTRDVVAVTTKDEALQAFKENHFVAALVDVKLEKDPNGGLDFLTEIQNQKRKDFKGAVVFSINSTISNEYPHLLGDQASFKVSWQLKPDRLDEGMFHKRCNKVFEKLWDIIRS